MRGWSAHCSFSSALSFLFLIEIRLKFNKQLSLWAYVPVQTLSKLPEGLLSPHAAPVLAGTARRTFVFSSPGPPLALPARPHCL